MVAMSVEPLGRALPAVVVFRRGRMPGSEVVEQCPRPAVLVAGGAGAVQVPAVVEVAVHRTHETVEHVAGPVTVGVIVGDGPQVAFVAQVQHLFQGDAAEVSVGPGSQAADTLREASTMGSVIGVPHLLRDRQEQLAEVLRPIADLQPRVQEALQDRHQREEELPRGLGRLPAVGVDGLRGVLGLHVRGFLLENAVRLLQVVGADAVRQRRSQHATASYRGGDVGLLAVAGLMVFVGQQVLGQRGPACRGAHDAVASQSDLHPIPIHRIAAKHASQSPKGHAELAEEQRGFHVVGPRRHIGHQERRTDRVRPAVAELDPSQRHALLARRASVLHGVPSREALRKQLRHFRKPPIQPLPKPLRVVHDRLIFIFPEGKANGSMPSTQRDVRSLGHDPPPCDQSAFGGSWPFS